MILSYKKQKIPYALNYSKRKSIGIKIQPPDKVTVTAPLRMQVQTIEKALITKIPWITSKLIELEKKESQRVVQTFLEGDELLYLGDLYPIKLIVNSKSPQMKMSFEGSYFHINTSSHNEEGLSELVKGWYRQETKVLVERYSQIYEEILGVKPLKIRIKEQKKRLGSCSSKGSLNYNWRLSMAPELSLASVVVHELCHMVHLNHSKEFWSLVHKTMPDYEGHRSWFKHHYLRMLS
jgi:predicted metal-dependent hydrolase